MALALAVCCRLPLQAQFPGGEPASDALAVYTDHPRLFLRPARLRLLKRERDRGSPRWRQLEAILTGSVPPPEPGFAEALYYQISGSKEAGRHAIAWALNAADLRQTALVFDWCQDLLTDAERTDLGARIARGMAALAADQSVPAVRSRVLAAVALYDHVPDSPRRTLEAAVRDWWNARIAPDLRNGRDALPRDDAYALFELLHVLRDNLALDARDSCTAYFKTLPIERLMSYYPPVYKGPENDFRVGIEPAAAEADPRLATLSRAADLAIVAYDSNAPESQALQGWLMHDRFIMRAPLGAPYEFLWANPYQPGLSYYHLPLTYYNPDSGTLFARSSWDDSAEWLGCFGGIVQKFQNGRITVLSPSDASPMRLGTAAVFLGPSASPRRIRLDAGEQAFVVALEPRRTYLVEVDREKPASLAAGPGGAIELKLPIGKEVSVRIR